MIFIHTYGIGKFGETIRQTVHESEESAEAAKAVLGGEVVQYFSAEEVAVEKYHMTNALCQELSDIIDDFSDMEPVFTGSERWDLKKMRAINMIKQIVEGDF